MKYCTLILTLLVISLNSDAKSIKDYKIKASWIKAISDNITWYDKKKHIICILGIDLAGLYLKELAIKDVIIKEKTQNQNFNDCHLLYISLSEERHILDILKEVSKYDIITISEINNFSKLGGVIEFIFENNFIRLSVNGNKLEELEEKTLYLDSYIMDVSKVVYK